MATRTLGTNANSSLVAIKYGADVADADIATIANQIYDDQVQNNAFSGATTTVLRLFPGCLQKQGALIIPNRGVLKPLPGDFIAIDTATGWPILISAAAIAGGPYTHT